MGPPRPLRRGCRRRMKRALITGITGQDGRYLAELPGREGLPGVRARSGARTTRRSSLVMRETPSLELVDGDLRDLSSLIAVVERVQPDEVYNLGAISFVHLSFTQPELTSEITGLGVLRMLEAVRIVGGAENNPIRFYQASSSEMFGKVRETPQTELTPFHPRSPVRRGQGVRPPHDRQLPRGVRPPRVVRHPVQPRVREARARVRHPQDHELVSRGSSSGCRTRSRSATSTPRATGASPATTSRRCG